MSLKKLDILTNHELNINFFIFLHLKIHI